MKPTILQPFLLSSPQTTITRGGTYLVAPCSETDATTEAQCVWAQEETGHEGRSAWGQDMASHLKPAHDYAEWHLLSIPRCISRDA